MGNLAAAAQLFTAVIVGLYFFTKLVSEHNKENNAEENKKEAEELNRMRHISLSEPLTEYARPKSFDEVIGQEEGIRALSAALCGENPQHVLIYGPPGIGKTAASRLVLEMAKKSRNTPFRSDAPFIEADATIMRFDERSIADPLIGSVHDPIYQGAGNLGVLGIPEPKAGAVSKAHGGVLFLDEIGELHPLEMNKLLKVLEDRRVILESSYYNSKNKKIPTYIHDIFQNGIPADFRLIGATTRKPSEIPEALRSRCVEIYFKELSLADIRVIIANAVKKTGKEFSDGVCEYISLYASSGRDAVKLVQTLVNTANLENRSVVTAADAKWAVESGRYSRRADAYKDKRIINISFINPGNTQ